MIDHDRAGANPTDLATADTRVDEDVDTLIIEYPCRVQRGGIFPLRVGRESLKSGRTITVVPRIPGCLVVPAEERLEKQADFWITPLGSGPVPGATVLFRCGARTIGRTPLELQIRSRVGFTLAILLALVLPWFGWIVGELETLGWLLSSCSACVAVWFHITSKPRFESRRTALDE